jgi:hypothetical protein
VASITQLDATHLHWKTKVGGVEREFDAGVTQAGVVTFHHLTDSSTKVMVQLDWEPDSLVEKAGAAVGADDHRVKADLKESTEFIGSRQTATGAWRGDVQL